MVVEGSEVDQEEGSGVILAGATFRSIFGLANTKYEYSNQTNT